MFKFIRIFLLVTLFSAQLNAQQSVARRWNEAMLNSIRLDFARPPVQARNLFHVSMAMYDAWAAYDTVARPYLLGNTVAGYTCPFDGVPVPADIKAARDEAISFAAYRVLMARFANSPNSSTTIANLTILMLNLGYNFAYTSTDYSNGNPAALGNYIGQSVIQMGYGDGSNELNNYAIQFYQPVNPPLFMAFPGNQTQLDPNRWQPLQLTTAIDQNGNPIGSTQIFQSPEWGRVVPFSLTEDDLTIYERDNHEYFVYHDPGTPPELDTSAVGGISEEFKWNMELVSVWGAHLDPNDGVLWDVSPASIGNNTSYPTTIAGLRDFYDLENGGDPGQGRPLNPKTGQPYPPQVIPRGDYTRVLAQFWADGPNSETPPGHWYSILNKAVLDHPQFERRFNGKGPLIDTLEWDVKAYFTLGGALHDAAISAWGIKGWYDASRPVTAIRYMAEKGQSSDPALPNYHPAGIQLIPGFIEQVQPGDPLAGSMNGNAGLIKLRTWRGPNEVTDPLNQIAGVDWILARNWWPYQRKTFVTPPFAGYISGHSTYSSTAAEALTLLTGDEYFPGGMGEFFIAANSNFLGLEQGPSVDVTLQWATYRDASDQTSLSRIWGGIHPPYDDIPGRFIGIKAGTEAFEKARNYFYKDTDSDGFYSFEDCDDHNPAIYPGATELCDGIDNDCNGLTDDNAPLSSFYADNDGDGFGDVNTRLDTCALQTPNGFVTNQTDCDDTNANDYPGAPELCDQLDNNCDGLVDEALNLFTYYRDEDNDGYGVGANIVTTCAAQAPVGFVSNQLDCNDQDATVFPGAPELCDDKDNDCNGDTDDNIPQFTYFADIDADGFGASLSNITTCLSQAPTGYTTAQGDCDDQDASIFPGATELCDNKDNNCNGETDENLPVFSYYQDADGDNFGTSILVVLSCLDQVPVGFSVNSGDCDDQDASVYPGAAETCDAKDNDCNGDVDDNLPVFVFYQDNDGDGFGTEAGAYSTCDEDLPSGYSINSLDCNDASAAANPNGTEVIDGLDNDCNGLVDDVVSTQEPVFKVTVFPNPAKEEIHLFIEKGGQYTIQFSDLSGKLIQSGQYNTPDGRITLKLHNLNAGIYFMRIAETNQGGFTLLKVVKE